MPQRLSETDVCGRPGAGRRGQGTGRDIKRIEIREMQASCTLPPRIGEWLYNPHQQLEGIGLIVNLIFLECPFFL